MKNRLLLMAAILAWILVPVWMSAGQARQERIAAPSPAPRESYSRPPDAPFTRSDYVIKINQMSSFYDKPGEFGYAIHGEEYGFDRLSFVLTETQPNGGPPLHTHTVEEAHVVLSGRVSYVIGDRRLTADGPYVARVPQWDALHPLVVYSNIGSPRSSEGSMAQNTERLLFRKQLSVASTERSALI